MKRTEGKINCEYTDDNYILRIHHCLLKLYLTKFIKKGISKTEGKNSRCVLGEKLF